MAKGNFGTFLFGVAVGAAYVFFTRTDRGKQIIEAGKARLDKACADACADSDTSEEDRL